MLVLKVAGRAYMENTCPEKRGQPNILPPRPKPSHLNRTFTCLPNPTALAYAHNFLLWPSWHGWKVGPGRMVTLPSQKATQIGGPTFCSHVSGSHPRFVRKCEKSWLTQGISGRLVTLLPWTTFLHINRALISSPDDVTGSWPFLQQRFPWYSPSFVSPRTALPIPYRHDRKLLKT